MEEPKAPEAAPPPPPPPSTTPQTQTQTQTQIPSATTRKRPLDSSDAHSDYFKIRAVIRDLRPHFIQVLQTPDYKNCKASQEIRERLKIVINLCDNMKIMDQKTLQDQKPQLVKSPEQLQVEKSFSRQSESKLTPQVPGPQKPQQEDSQIQGSYVVGGSAFGWNFITFSGKEPVYYGRTKEQFRSANAAAKVTE